MAFSWNTVPARRPLTLRIDGDRVARHGSGIDRGDDSRDRRTVSIAPEGVLIGVDEIAVRDQPVAADIGCRNTGREKIAPIATQPMNAPAATITQR